MTQPPTHDSSTAGELERAERGEQSWEDTARRNARLCEEQRLRAEAAEKLAADRADQIKNLRDRWAYCRTRLAKQEAETMRQLERAKQAEAALVRVRAVAGWAIQGWSDLSPEKVLAALGEPAPAATKATELETTARVASALHRSAEADVTRVLELYERWVKAGPPPLGTSLARWWDRRLADLHDAIQPADQTTEK